MTKDQCKAIKDAFNKLMVDNGLVEDPETQKARNEEFVRTEKKNSVQMLTELLKQT